MRPRLASTLAFSAGSSKQGKALEKSKVKQNFSSIPLRALLSSVSGLELRGGDGDLLAVLIGVVAAVETVESLLQLGHKVHPHFVGLSLSQVGVEVHDVEFALLVGVGSRDLFARKKKIVQNLVAFVKNPSGFVQNLVKFV